MRLSIAGRPSAIGRAFFALAAVTYGLLVFGASVRVHGAGLSCPDWPLCFGQLIPELDFQIFMEWGHRVLASAVSIGFLGLGGAVLAKRELRGRAGVLVGVAALGLATQVVLGGLTVLKLLAFWSVTLHLLTGNFFFVLLLLVGIRLTAERPPASAPSAVRGFGIALVAMVFVQMALGGLVSSNYAGLACTEWPTCNGGVWFPVWDGIVGLQVVHRLGAYTLLGVSGAFLYSAWRVPSVRRPAGLVFGLVLVQATVGILNVLLAMPVEVAILHSAVADLIVAATTWAVARAWASPAAHHVAVPAALVAEGA